ncbi:MAG: GNAT family N-acetyltransferase, partial [Opitutaceae bacterium]
GKGNARILMGHLEVEAQQRGCHGIRLDAYLRNPAALKLYVTLGYRRAGLVEFRKGSFACYEKRLSEPRSATTAVNPPR